MTEDYISFEVAKLLKEKGFDEPIRCWYDNFQDFHEEGVRMSNTDCLPPTIMCPTHQMAMKWLREKDIIIIIQPEYFNIESKCSAWGVDIWAGDNYEKLQGDFPSYEEAVEAALKYSLENLI